MTINQAKMVMFFINNPLWQTVNKDSLRTANRLAELGILVKSDISPDMFRMNVDAKSLGQKWSLAYVKCME